MAFNRIQDDEGNQIFVADGGNSENAENITEFEEGVDAAFGRGETSTGRTYIRLRRTDGTNVYLSVNTGTTLTVSSSKP